jgi:OOP family OmpA-OmpF porin
MIETAMRCPSAAIEVGGHTDTDGDADANMTLSQRRAQAVVDYMVRAGMPADRLKAVGYGQTEPVASNDTDEGKAQNRRIEFLVR